VVEFTAILNDGSVAPAGGCTRSSRAPGERVATGFTGDFREIAAE